MKKMTGEQEQGFITFWALWKKRVAKADAMKAWLDVAPKEYPAIVAAVPRHFAQPTWNKDSMAYVPYPASWIRGRRWEDEIILPEDNDAEFFIQMIQKHPVLPEGLSLVIKNRAIKMFTRMQSTWPRLHALIQKDPGAIAEIRKEFLDTK